MHIVHRFSVVAEIVEALRSDLQAREWTERLPSERVLCERLQVSRPTLRKALTVLAQEGWIRPQRGVGWRVGRVPPKRARARGAKSLGILCFVPLDQASGFTLFAIDKLQDHFHNAGLSVHVHAGTQYASQNYRQALERLVHGSPATAWVLVGSRPETAGWFQDRRIPIFVTLTTRKPDQFPALRLDLDAAYRHVVELLARLKHQRIALVLPRPVSGGTGTQEGDNTLQAWQATYRDTSGLAERVVWHTRRRESVHRVLSTVFGAASPPTALVVVRPQHALAVVTYLTTSGIRVPQDVSVISLGYESFLDHVRPSIAHYALDRKAYARKLCRLVLPWAKTGYWSPQESSLMMQFHEGESLAAVR